MDDPARMKAVLATLQEAYRGDGPLRAAGRPVIGFVGQDVPVEVIAAAGAIPLRLRGQPGAGTQAGDHYLGTGLDPSARSLLTLLLDGAFGPLDGLVVSSDCEASLRLFYVLREIARVEPATHIPPVTLVDMLHLPRGTTAAYNLARIRQLAESMRTWTGSPITEEGLAIAVAEQDEIRRLQRQVSDLRHDRPARLSGSEYLSIVGAATRLPAAEYRTLLETLTADAAALPEHEGMRVFLTGSSHDNPAVYGAIESTGAVIVGEDHDWGELLAEREVGAPTLDALAERYQYNGPTSPRSPIRERAAYTARAAERAAAEVLLGYTRVHDDAPLWDFAAQQAAVGVPGAIITRQPYGLIDHDELEETLDALGQQEGAA